MAAAEPRRSVLVIEDEQDTRDMYVVLLGHSGFDVGEHASDDLYSLRQDGKIT